MASFLVDVVVILVLVSCMMTSLAATMSKTYRVQTDATGGRLCSTDPPSAVIAMKVGTLIRCGVQCAVATSCQFYQFKSALAHCEVFNYSPTYTSMAVVDQCVAYTSSTTVVTTAPSSAITAGILHSVNPQTTSSAPGTTVAVAQAGLSSTAITTAAAPSSATTSGTSRSVNPQTTSSAPGTTVAVAQAGLSSTAITTAGIAGTPTVVATVSNNNQFVALALLNGQLFVTRYGNNVVFVYNATSLQLMRQITSATFGYSLIGLATSASINCLYIVDQMYVRRVNLSVTSTTSVTAWSLTSTPQKLSMTNSGNVLVLTSDYAISEYTPSGSLVRKFTDGSEVKYAMEVSNGAWVYSINSPNTGIRMAMNGTVMKKWETYAGSAVNQMCWPNGMTVDAQGYILVADTSNSRIVVVNPSLTDARLLPIPTSTNLNQPFALALDQSSGRLYVGETSGSFRVLAFEDVTNIFALFSK